jgi:hypothetical protein
MSRLTGRFSRPSGHSKASALHRASTAMFEALEPRKMLSADFDRDGASDVVFHHKTDDQVVVRYGNGGSAVLGNVGPEWDVEGYGDFNGDGRDDILWRNHQTGENVAWFMNNEAITGSVFLPAVDIYAGWEVEGVGNFAGDARPDLLWRNAYTGGVLVWVMGDAGTIASTAEIEGMSDMQWHIAGVADFNDDGRDDILWRDDDEGSNAVWLMNGTTRTAVASLPRVQGLEWSIIAVGNFAGTADEDIAWRRSSDGATIVWRMDDTTVDSSTTLSWPPSGEWHAGGGDNRSRGNDWDRNGTEDILWLDDQNGRGLQWYMDGTQIDGTNTINNLDQQVRGLMAVGDFDNQRGLDFLVRDPDTGMVSILLRVAGRGNFVESNHGILGQIDLAAITDTAWVIEGVGDFNGDEWLDIAWRHGPSGDIAVWTLINGRYAAALNVPGVADSAWEIRAVKEDDINDTVELYWRNNATGENVVWTVVGDTIAGSRFLFTVDDDAWRLEDAVDFGGDGFADALWMNTESGEVRIWQYGANGYEGSVVIGERPTANSNVVQ